MVTTTERPLVTTTERPLLSHIYTTTVSCYTHDVVGGVWCACVLTHKSNHHD